MPSAETAPTPASDSDVATEAPDFDSSTIERLERWGVQSWLNKSEQQAYVLVPGPAMALGANDLIWANKFLATAIPSIYSSVGSALYGFEAVDPDGNPETAELFRLGDMGTSGEGMRTVDSLGTTDGTGPAQHAITFESPGGEIAIETDTMGIGYIDLTAYAFDGTMTSGKLFFNYGNSLDEPVLTHNKTQVSHETEPSAFTGVVQAKRATYEIDNPILYSDAEMTALRYKFGFDATLAGTEERYTSTTKNAIDRSVDALCRAIETKFRNPMQTFPRTPPLRYNKSQFEAIRDDEASETTSDFIAPATTDTGGSY